MTAADMSGGVDFKLRQVLQGHTDDVRAIASFDEGGCLIVTASRDKMLKGWQETSAGWQDTFTLVGHTHYVVAVRMVPAGRVPGLSGPGVLSGSRDATVRLWSLDSKEALRTLQGHTHQVNAVGVLPSGQVASGSLDGTLKVWKGEEAVHSVKAHETSVLCLLALQGGDILTGSGDQTIKRWRDGHLAATYTGHSDSVRSLCELPGTGFVSASHDMTLRVWSSEGATMAQLVGHTALIYSCAATPAGLIASGSEDNTVRLWAGSECVQTIPVPGCAWCVGFTPSGDLLAGTSSFCAYVWTQAPEKQAGEDVVQAFEADIASRHSDAAGSGGGSGGAGGVPEDQIKPQSALLMPGSKDGAVMFVRNAGGAVEAHEWSTEASSWSLIGEVMAQAPDTLEQPKKRYEGREWDYVFDVDVADGQPPLKLPMDRGEDPYEVAERFIAANGLPATYREQIVRFIVQNTADESGPTAPRTAARDPLSEGAQPSAPTAPAHGFVYTPHRQHQTFEAVPATEKLAAKLKEFSPAVPASDQLTDADLAMGGPLEHLLQLLPRKGAGLGGDCVEVLGKLARWPAAQLFPVLDIFRVLLLNAGTAKLLSYDAGALQEGNPGLGGLLARGLGAGAPAPAVLTALRMACNCCQHAPLRTWLLSDTAPLFDLLADGGAAANKNVRAALATLLLNFGVAVCCGQVTDGSDGRARALSILCELNAATEGSESDTKFRLFLAVTTIAHGDKAATELVRDLGFASEASSAALAPDCPERLKGVANDVALLLKS